MEHRTILETKRLLTAAQRNRRIADGNPTCLATGHEKGARRSLVKDLSWAEFGAGPQGETGRDCRRPGGDPGAMGRCHSRPSRRGRPAIIWRSPSMMQSRRSPTSIRGEDLFASTSVHRLPAMSARDCQPPDTATMGWFWTRPAASSPKSDGATSIASLRDQGATRVDIIARGWHAFGGVKPMSA